jgi:hypothetical protein
MHSQLIADFKDAGLALVGILAAIYAVRGTYYTVKDGVAATLAKQDDDREQRKINRRHGLSHLTS